MTHVHVCRLCKSCQCLVCLTCLAGKMSSKTILIGLSIFRCGVEKSVHGRPSWELAPYDCSLQNTKDFTAWCKLVSRECKFNDRAGECGVVRYTTQFFVLDKAKALPIRIGSQKGRESGDKGTKRYGKREVVTPLFPPPFFF